MPVGTLGDMKNRIADELARPDLTAQIEDAILDAIAIYQKERFRFSDVTPLAEPTFSTVAGRWVYGLADNANITTVFHIDYLHLLQGGDMNPLEMVPPQQLRLMRGSGTQTGEPWAFAYEGNALLLHPTPNAAYVLTIGGHLKIAAPENDGEANNKWMTDGEQLIRSRAKFEIATHVTGNASLAARMSPDPDQVPHGAAYRAYRALKGEAGRVTGRGRIRSMQF